jgi:hypothetical protein
MHAARGKTEVLGRKAKVRPFHQRPMQTLEDASTAPTAVARFPLQAEYILPSLFGLKLTVSSP